MGLPIKFVATITNPSADEVVGVASDLRITFSELYGTPGEVATASDLRLRVTPGRGLYGADPSTRVWTDAVLSTPIPTSVYIPDGGGSVVVNTRWTPPIAGDVLLGVFSGDNLLGTLALYIATVSGADVNASCDTSDLPKRVVRPPANPPAEQPVVSNHVRVRFGNTGSAASNAGIGRVYAKRGGKNAAGVVDGWVSYIDADFVEVGSVPIPSIPKGASVTLNVPVSGFVAGRGGVILRARAEVPGAKRTTGSESQVLE